MRDVALDAVAWTAQPPFPDFTRRLRIPWRCATEAVAISNRGSDIDVADFEEHIHEEHVAHSTAPTAHQRATATALMNAGGGTICRPLARHSLNYDKLLPIAQDAARAAGLGPTC
ncbi:MAG: hypothetical protein R2854_11805 [Caldilineaceae bacterium]